MTPSLRYNNSVSLKVISFFKNLGNLLSKLNILLYFLILGHLLAHKFKMPIHCFNYVCHREQSFSVFQGAEDYKMQNILWAKS